MPADSTIYNQLWEADTNRFSVSVRDAQGNWVNPNADILLDHQTKSGKDSWTDLAALPLFSQVKKQSLEQGTYAALIQMFNNYVVNFRDPEVFTQEENKEIEDFLVLILDTPPMKLAYDYITEELGKRMSKDEFLEEVEFIWFDPYTNYFGNDAVEYCSGFEHVFVGEGKFNPLRGGGPRWGDISGYHNWVKFYLDESNGRVNFLGTQYKLPAVSEVLNPDVITLQMTWTLSDIQGNPVGQVFKERGGFFVGTSPECEMAMGTVAYYESIQNLTVNERRAVKIQKGNYNLVMYRETTEDNKRGQHIRSFYPEFRGGDFEPLPRPGSTPVLKPIEDSLIKDGVILIVAALPNPSGGDETGEWVEIKNNSTEAISLDNWFLTDKIGRKQVLSGSLAVGETWRFTVRTNSPRSMQLGNSGGRIILLRPDGEIVASVFYNRTQEGEVINF